VGLCCWDCCWDCWIGCVGRYLVCSGFCCIVGRSYARQTPAAVLNTRVRCSDLSATIDGQWVIHRIYRLIKVSDSLWDHH
jgi:hypothetical protein